MPSVNKPGQRPRALVAAISLALAASGAHAATFNVTSSDDAGPGTLREAISDINSQGGSNIIDLSPISGGTIVLASDLPELEIEDNATTELRGSEVTLSGDDQHTCLSVKTGKYSDRVVVIDNLTVTGCDGAIVAGDVDLFVSHSSIVGNAASTENGGGIRMGAGELTIESSVLSGNSTAYQGGAIYTSQSATISDTEISNNSAQGNGGGVYVRGELLITDSIFTDNSAYAGGGIHADGNLTITDSAISNNSAPYAGGGIHAGGNLTITDSTISNNSAHTGGGLFTTPLSSSYFAHIENTVVSGNQAVVGGGLEIEGFETVRLIDSEVADNAADNSYGGLRVFLEGDDAVLDVRGTTLSGNSAGDNDGGGFMAVTSYYGTARATLRNVTVSGNSADSDVGGLEVAMYGSGNESILFDGVTITNNEAGGDVGGLNVYSYLGGSAGFEIRNSIIAGNTAGGSDDDLGMLQGGPGGPAGMFGSGANSGPSATQADINVNYTLLGTPPSAPEFILDAVSQALVGEDPVLGPLADNGGPTPTHLPGDSGAGVNVIPSGSSGCGNDFDTDQRGEPRPEPGGSDCDLGSVELQDNGGSDPDPDPELRAVPVPVNQPLALGILAFGAGLLGLLGLRRRRNG